MIHDFQERLAFSEGIILEQNLIDHLLDSIPGSISLEQTGPHIDKSGVDYWIVRRGLPPVGIDIKHRSYCPIARWGSDDACVETTSVYVGPEAPPYRDEYRVKSGWTVDQEKRTDLIVYTWPATEGHRRFWILYFPHLCRAAQANWRIWAAEYGEKPARNDSYITLSVYPPRRVIAKAMRQYVVGIA